jgi:hypothetical protein
LDALRPASVPQAPTHASLLAAKTAAENETAENKDETLVLK